MKRLSSRRRRMIRASELSQLGVREQLVVFEHLQGKKKTAAQQAAIDRGHAAHRVFQGEAIATDHRLITSESSRCVIATTIFGDLGPETRPQRRYRDDVLASCPFGRVLIRCYYCFSPTIARSIQRSTLRQIGRWMLKPIVGIAGWHLRQRSRTRPP